MKIAISSDHGGNNLRKEIMTLLDELNISYRDFGPQSSDSVDYPDYAKPVADGVASGEFERGILVCGTGIGMSIAANKVKVFVVHLFMMCSVQKQLVATTILIF